MTAWLGRFRTFIFLACCIVLLSSANCAKVSNFFGSADPYHTRAYKKVSNAWTREARIHSGLQVELIVSATFKSAEFRRAYTDEYATAYKLTPEEKEAFWDDQLTAATSGHEFVVASFVPDKKWDDFDKAQSMWRIYLINDNNERVTPVQVRRVKKNDAVTSHFFPYVTPWKSIYTVRFPWTVSETNEAIIKGGTTDVRLVIASVVGTAEMRWQFE